MARASNPYGDGRAAERIAGYVRALSGAGGTLPFEFKPLVA
jgi:UDP-N-acetylglucosamine 2-epimerase